MALRGHTVAATTRDTQIRCLVMACGPCHLAVPADWLRSILTQEEAGNGETILSSGVAYPMTDLTGRLRLPGLTPSSETRIILYGNQTRVCAFAVDRVLELVESERHDVRPLPAQFRNAERHRLAGFFLYQDTVALIINPVWLLEAGARLDPLAPAVDMVELRPRSEGTMAPFHASPAAEIHVSAHQPLK